MPQRHQYNPNQPRVPKGHSTGGQWTDGDYGQDTILQEGDRSGAGSEHDTILQAGWKGQDTILQSLFFRRPRSPDWKELDTIVRRGVEAAATLFAVLSALNNERRQAVIAFNARDYRRITPESFEVEYVRMLGREEAGEICKKLEKVQARTDAAVDKVRARGLSYSPAVYGTHVHHALKLDINALKNPDFLAEVSMLKTAQETKGITDAERKIIENEYGKEGSIRVDVLENRNDTVCVYDIKTGLRGLHMPRPTEMPGESSKGTRAPSA